MAVQIKEVTNPFDNSKAMSVRIEFDKAIIMPLSVFYELKMKINEFTLEKEGEQ